MFVCPASTFQQFATFWSIEVQDPAIPQEVQFSGFWGRDGGSSRHLDAKLGNNLPGKSKDDGQGIASYLFATSADEIRITKCAQVCVTTC